MPLFVSGVRMRTIIYCLFKKCNIFVVGELVCRVHLAVFACEQMLVLSMDAGFFFHCDW